MTGDRSSKVIGIVTCRIKWHAGIAHGTCGTTVVTPVDEAGAAVFIRDVTLTVTGILIKKSATKAQNPSTSPTSSTVVIQIKK